MRYNCKALYTLDEVAEQCRNAIMKATTPIDAALASQPLYDAILESARWENDLLIAS